MKPHLDIAHEGTLDGDRIGMTFDEGSIAHIMSVLTDLYSDPQLAVLREYATNAYDSHIEAGNTDPIEVSLPTEIRPSLVIRDNGVGMSLDTITTQFSKYGWSSKRETNEQAGMLGLGCKSALAFTSQFTLVSRYNGLKITVLVTRQESGAGAVQIVDTSATTERNGVEVKIPGSAEDFRRKAERFFQFWKPGTVVIDGEAPRSFIDSEVKVIELDPDIYLVSGIQRSQVVMGNVPYPVATNRVLEDAHGRYSSRTSSMSWHVVAYVPMGSVDFTPSREELNFSKRTVETLETIRDFVNHGVLTNLQAEVDSIGTGWEAWKWENRALDGNLMSYFFRNHRNKITYRGDKFPGWRGLPVDENRTLHMPTGRPNHWDKQTATRTDSLSIGDIETTALWIVGQKAKSVTAKTKAQARLWYNENLREILDRSADWNGKRRQICFIDKLPDSTFFPKNLGLARVVELSVIREVVLPAGDIDEPKRYHWWRIVKQDGYIHEPRADDVSGEITPLANDIGAWISAGAEDELGGTGISKFDVARTMAIFGVKLANVPKGSIDRFQREYPNIPTVKAWVGRTWAGLPTPSVWQQWLVNDQYDAENETGIERELVNADYVFTDIMDRDLVALNAEYQEYAARADYVRQNTIDAVEHLCLNLRLRYKPKEAPDTSAIRRRYEVLTARYPLFHELKQYFRSGRDGGHRRHRSEWADWRVRCAGAYEYLDNQFIIRNQLHLIPVI